MDGGEFEPLAGRNYRSKAVRGGHALCMFKLPNQMFDKAGFQYGMASSMARE